MGFFSFEIQKRLEYGFDGIYLQASPDFYNFPDRMAKLTKNFFVGVWFDQDFDLKNDTITYVTNLLSVGVQVVNTDLRNHFWEGSHKSNIDVLDERKALASCNSYFQKHASKKYLVGDMDL